MPETAIVIRIQEEIVARAQERKEHDMFGFEAGEYLNCLDYEHLKPFLKADLTAEETEVAKAMQVMPLEAIDLTAKEYMAFWLEKIENERGLSVCRATAHYIAWKWLLGHEDSDTFPGSINGGDGGWYQRTAYEYIKRQMDSGEWDKLNAAAREKAVRK